MFRLFIKTSVSLISQARISEDIHLTNEPRDGVYANNLGSYLFLFR